LLKQIAKKIVKHHSTLSREIFAGSTASYKGAYARITNRGILCATQLCMDKPDCLRRCATCRRSNGACPNYREEIFAKLSRAPYVCNDG